MSRAVELTATALQQCRACDLWATATQVVPGSGPVGARLMLVGEQPGDKEDQRGVPFVGPAGRVLDDALERAGIQRDDVFLTNAVKHFKWKPAPRGKRRLHQRPNRAEIVACHPWLETEVRTVRPQVVVCLGALATESVIGADWKVTEHRGQLTTALGVVTLATFHPSAVLRLRDRADREQRMAELVADLQAADAASMR